MKYQYFKSLLTIIFAVICTSLSVFAQTRSGSIDLTGAQGRKLYIGEEYGNQIGIEGSDFTVEAWIKPVSGNDNDFTFFKFINRDKSGSDWHKLSLSHGGDGEEDWQIVADRPIRDSDGHTYGDDYVWLLNSNQSGFSMPDFSLEEWHHIAFSLSGGNSVKIYVDGELSYSHSNLNISGNSVDLFPDGSDGFSNMGGECYFGGNGAKSGNDEGKFYMGEVRVFTDNLSTSTIQKYYNREINDDHPNWGDLVRYYHGTESSGTGTSRTFEDRSDNGDEYDAWVDNSDVVITTSTGFTPPVAPPEIEGSSFDGFAAADCDEGDISLSWNNMHTNGYSRYDVGYKIVRASDNSTIYDEFSSNKTSFTDVTVSEGTSTDYYLYTYYEIDGVKHYSDDYESNTGSRIEEFSDPSSFTATTDQCDKSIDLSWATDNPPSLKIKYSSDGVNYSTLTSPSGDATSYTATNMATDKTVYFQIYNTGTDAAGCTVEENIVSTTGSTSTEPTAPTGLTISADDVNQEITVNWTDPSGNNATSWTVQRTDQDGTVSEYTVTDVNTTSYLDASVAQCVTYDYAIASENACGTTYSSTSVNETVGADLSSAISSLTASKGYYSDNVFLEWSSDNLAAIDRFRLYRSKADENNYSLIKVLENDLTYSDETALGGNVYTYKIEGEATCNTSTVFTGAEYDQGFILPYGIVNGHIEYEGGNAVEDVNVTVTKSSGEAGSSLSFDDGSYIKVEDPGIQMGGASWSFECWMKNSQKDTISPLMLLYDGDGSWELNERMVFFNADNSFGLAVNGDNNYRLADASSIRDGEWHHVAFTYNHDNAKNTIYFDGIEQTGTLFESGHDGSKDDMSGADLYFANKHASGGKPFHGNMDEIRFWDHERSEVEIVANMNRYLNGDESGLKIYFRCDEGMGTGVYDASRADDVWNENHGEFVGANVYFSDDIPSSDQLGIKGTTDEYGDYTIGYVPYSSSGQTFRVTPSFGQHVFEPNTRTIYIGNGAQTQNNLDFTDVSSFEVSGKATYYNTNVPVVDAVIYVDGEYGRDAGGSVVRTDDNGDYSVAVPIGYHYISIEKDGHYFSEGYFPPLNEYGDIDTYEFVEDLTVNFTDSTYVIVAGRVVGGNVQGSKTLGFDKSTNNVGTTTLNFDLENEAWALPTQSVTTDASTGEYEIHLIPETFVVSDFTTQAGYSMSELPVIDFSNSLDDITAVDSVYDYEYYNNGTLKDSSLVVNEYVYNHELNYVFSESPLINVYQTGESGMVGDTIIYYTDQETGSTDTAYFGSSSALNYPVFQMGGSYDMNIEVFEQYSNPYHPDGALVDIVPVSDADVVIVNGLMAGGGTIVGSTDADGLYTTTFLAGLPSISENGSESYTQSLEVYTEVDGQTYYWTGDGGNVMRAYILGSYPLAGTDFITYGPEVPEIILRDPPGSNSYAYIEKGSSFAKTTTYGMNSVSNSTLDYTFHTGLYALVGAGAFSETDYVMDNTYGLTLGKEYNSSGEYVETVTFNDRIETSSDPEDVGSEADVYIGKAYNAYVSQTKSLKPMRKAFADANAVSYAGGNATDDDDIVLGLIDGFAINDDSASTYFMYSQKHIVQELIPDLIILRNNLFLNPEYVSNFDPSHRYYGLSNSSPSLDAFKIDTINADPSVDTANISYTFTQSYSGQIDSVEMLNQQIDIWLSTILINEMEKAEAVTEKNIAIDGSIGIYSSSITQSYNSSYNYARKNSMGFYTDAEMGLTQNGKGFTLSTTSDGQYTYETSEGNTRNNSVEFGYVIDERDEGDYYSIDVKYDEAVKYTSFDDINKNVSNVSLDDYDLVKGLLSGGAAGTSIGVTTKVWSALSNSVVDKAAKGNAIAASISFGIGASVHLLDLATLYPYAAQVKEDVNSTEVFRVQDFAISSPVFSIKGGQSKCPYEGDEFTTVYTDNNGDYYKLHTGTLQREVPVIDVTPSIRTDVPESEAAIFTLELKNESASGSDAWYEIEILDGTNPDGLSLLIDGLTAERTFYVEAFQTLEKTLTATKTNPSINDYDSVGVVFKSTCQYDPVTIQDDIGDTVYISVSFLPECSTVDISGGQDGWIINYDDNDQAVISLEDYDINASSLETVSFQYKTTSGSPITVKSFFVDTTSTDYQNYTGEKDLLTGGGVNLTWDLSSLSDRDYQIRAKSTCSDGSVYESDYYTGTVDRITPTVFGTPQPSDGIYGPGDDISVRFNEDLEIGLIKDFNFSVQAVLNGSDVSHGTSVLFNGSNEYASIPSVSFNDKSFAVEFWLKREAGSEGMMFSKGSGAEEISVFVNSDESITVDFGGQSYNVDPSAIYTVTYPVDGWHHWALSYDNENEELQLIGDDQLLLSQANVSFSSSTVENLYLASSASNSDYLDCQIHEVRIWEQARSLTDVVANFGITLNGSESGLYGYWAMDEGDGSLILDKAAGRNMTIDAQWELYPGSDAFYFDGANQYLTLDGSNLAITDETDFSVEFWFKGNTPLSDATLFSTGKGDLTDTLANSDYALAIIANSLGQINVLSNGNSFSTSGTTDVFNDQWHHFALIVDRDGASKLYLDGDLQTSSTSTGIAGIAGANAYLGARGYTVDDAANGNLAVDQFFTGSIDEFRIWNSARNSDYLATYMNTKLTGEEPGLQLYLPFESYDDVMGTIVRTTTLDDEAIPQYSTQAGTAVASSTETFVSGASITDVRPIQDVDFTYVVNTDEIVITPQIDAYKIEGQTLEISVSGMNDLYSNTQLSTASWTAYVQRNELVWQESSMSIEHEEGTTSTFTATISNLGGTSYDYTLDDMPGWLTADATTGTVSPASTKTITFTVNSGLSIGYYEQSINLSTYLGFNEKLTIQVNSAAEAPDWTMDPSQYQYGMSVFGRLIVEGVISTDENDIVAAYVGNELRGVGNMQYMSALDEYRVFLTIYSNSTQGEKIDLVVWDASEGVLREDVTPNLTFSTNSIVGTSANPQDIEASDMLTTSYDLNSGWNWISFNLDDPNLSNVDSIFNPVGSAGDIVRAQSTYDIYDPATSWYGDLTLNGGLNNSEMYKVYVADGGTIKITGNTIDPSITDIDVVSGWNYVGFTPQMSMTVEEALAGMNPTTGDLIKSQYSFAMYDDAFGWMGSLSNLSPKNGYMIYSSKSATYNYPTTSSLSSGKVAAETPIDFPEEWINTRGKFASSMSIIAEVAHHYAAHDEEILVALSGNEIRGYASKFDFNGNSLFFLSPGGNDGDELTFALYNSVTKEITTAKNIITYSQDEVLGSPLAPYQITFDSVLLNSTELKVVAYPNPFTHSLNLELECETGTVQILDAVGNLLNTSSIDNGTLTMELGANYPTGIYLLRVVSPCGTQSLSIVKN